MTCHLEVISTSARTTQAIAAAIAHQLLPGDVIILDGDLGAGKTTFTQGLAQAMGVRDHVTSPTFTLVRTYPTSFGIDLIHVDVYRLDHLHEIESLGLPELLDDRAVAAIEWGERALPAIGPDHLKVRLELVDNPAHRKVILTPVGSRWDARWADLTTATEAAA